MRLFPSNYKLSVEIMRTLYCLQIQAPFLRYTYSKGREPRRERKNVVLLSTSVLFHFSAYFMLYRALKDLSDYRFSLVAAYN